MIDTNSLQEMHDLEEWLFEDLAEKSTTELPIYKINGKLYFRDKRLSEYRNINNPNDRIGIDDVDLRDLQDTTEEDKKLIKEVLE